jgi:mRNA interferase MazF
MPQHVQGEVVVVPFPFSDHSAQKRRPAMVLVDLGGHDVMLCQITSQTVRDGHAIPITARDFASGALRVDSNVRPGHIFTFERSLIVYSCGRLSTSKTEEILGRLILLLKRS